jgi:hypothetical protein
VPRVTTHTARASKYERRCRRCGQPMEPGQRYYFWSRRVSPENYQHVDCGFPRPTQLSSRKTAVVEEAIHDAQTEMGNWSPGSFDEVYAELFSNGVVPSPETMELDTSDLLAALEAVADAAGEVAAEYEEGADNMPDSLQSSPTAEAMRAVAEELESWQDELRSWEADNTQVELPEPANFETPKDWHDASEQMWDEAVEEARQSAMDAMDNMPEYQG